MVKISPVHVPFLFYTSPWCLFHRLDTIEHVSTCVDGITTEGTYSRFCYCSLAFLAAGTEHHRARTSKITSAHHPCDRCSCRSSCEPNIRVSAHFHGGCCHEISRFPVPHSSPVHRLTRA